MNIHCAYLVIYYLATLAFGHSLSSNTSVLVRNVWFKATTGYLDFFPSIQIMDLIPEPNASVWTTSLFALRPCLDDQLSLNGSISQEGDFRHVSIFNYQPLTHLLSREYIPYALPNISSYYLSPWASGWPQFKIVSTFDIVLPSVLSSDYYSWSPLLEYLYHSSIRLLKNSSIYVYYSSENKSKLAALQASRGYMLKYEYANRICALFIQLPPPYSGIFLFYAYPAHYVIMHNILRMSPYVINNINNSWFSISMWYDIEFQMSNKACNDIKSHLHSCTCLTDRLAVFPELYGGGKFELEYKALHPYVLDNQLTLQDEIPCKFIAHSSYNDAMEAMKKNSALIVCRMPIGAIAHYLTISQAKTIAKVHGLFVARGAQLTTIVAGLVSHQCSLHCYDNVYIFKPNASLKEYKQSWKAGISNAKRKEHQKKEKPARNQQRKTTSFKTKRVLENKKAYKIKKYGKFPPTMPTKNTLHRIICGFCKDTHPSQFQESGCAVCGKLSPLCDLLKLDKMKCSLNPLIRNGVTALERTSETDELEEHTLPILDFDCYSVCGSCHSSLRKGVRPLMALANGLWLGKVPTELKELTFVEQMLISWIRRNRCIIKVAAG
jgi:hypothetical protein